MIRAMTTLPRWLILGVALVFALSLPVQAQTVNHPFTDVTGDVYSKAIGALWELGVVTGTAEGRYSPTGPVTRAQMATLIVRAIGKGKDAEALLTQPTGFLDVSASHWARGFVVLANQMGIVKGDGTRFMPDDPVNYAQAVTMLIRALGYESTIVQGYPTGYVIKANELGLLKDVNFRLFDGVNRAEAAVLLYNAVFLVPQAENGLTLSQSVFKKTTALTLEPIPEYVTPGAEIELKVIASDSSGTPVPTSALNFTVVSGIGQISGNTLTAGGGTITVRVTSGDLSATATTNVVSNLTITPSTFQASKGNTVQLTANATVGDKQVPVQPTWSVLEGPATVTAGGLVTVTDNGTVKVQAALGSFRVVAEGHSVGKVAMGEIPEYLVPGQAYSFTATVTDSSGQAMDTAVTWSATGGIIDAATGRLAAATGTQVVVRAAAGGVSDSRTIPVLQAIAISPNTPAVLRGKELKFTARALDAAGKQYEIQPTWERSAPSVGLVSADGTFVGTGSGSTIVTAKLGTLLGSTTVRVSGPPARISVTATSTSLPANSRATTAVKITLLDDTGALSPVDSQPFSLTLTDANQGSLDRYIVLANQGEATVQFTSGASSGTVGINVSAPGTGLANQTLLISTYQQTPTQIQLSASPQPLAAGGGVASVTATLQDEKGFPAPAAQPLIVNLSISGSAGSLAGNTITIPAGRTSGSLTFISNSTIGTVQINGTSTYPVQGTLLQTANAGAVANVKIRPITEKTPITGLTSLRVMVDVLDAAGVVRAQDNTTKVRLSVIQPTGLSGAEVSAPTTYTATASGGTATFVVPAYAIGTVNLRASLAADDSVSDSTKAEFVPGIASVLRVTSQVTSLAADGFSQTQITAEVVDRNGQVIADVNPSVTFQKLVDANATNAITDLTVQTVNGRAILTVRSTRAPGTDVWYAKAPGLETQNLVTINTAAGSLGAYTLRLVSSTTFSTGTANQLVVQVVDQQGNVVTSDSGRTLSVTHTLPGVTITPTAVTQNGSATFTVTGSQNISGNVTFSAPGLPVSTLSVPVTFGTAGTAYSLFVSSSTTSARVGTTVTVWVRVMDTQGMLLSTDNGRVITATINGYGTLSSNQATTTGGLASFTVTGVTQGTAVLTFSTTGLAQSQSTLTIAFTN